WLETPGNTGVSEIGDVTHREARGQSLSRSRERVARERGRGWPYARAALSSPIESGSAPSTMLRMVPSPVRFATEEDADCELRVVASTHHDFEEVAHCAPLARSPPDKRSGHRAM